MKRVRIIGIAVLAVIWAAVLCGCSLSYNFTRVGEFDIGYSKSEKNAYVAHCHWNKIDREFTLPEDYLGYPVTELGGYYGRGVPTPFCVEVGDKIDYDAVGIGFEGGSDDCEILAFTIHLGQNIKKLTNVSGKQCLLKRIYDDDGNYLRSEEIYKIVYRFTVHSANPVFYAEIDGILRYKENGEAVDGFFYAADEGKTND